MEENMQNMQNPQGAPSMSNAAPTGNVPVNPPVQQNVPNAAQAPQGNPYAAQPPQSTQPPVAGQTFYAPPTAVWANGCPPQQNPAAAPVRPGTMPDGQTLQRELERQMRAFGTTVSDGIQYGFNGRQDELGNRAKDMGNAFMDVVNYGIVQGKQAMNAAQAQARAQNAANAYLNYAHGAGYGSYRQRNRNRYDRWSAASHQPKSPVRSKANTRFGIGLAEVIIGGIMLFSLGLGGAICLGMGLGMFISVLEVVGNSLLAGCLPFLWLTIRGAKNLKAAGKLRAYASVIGLQQSASIAALAQASQRSLADTKKDLRKMIRRGWIMAWIDENTQTLYLSEQAYYAAVQQQQAAEKSVVEQAEQKQKEEQETKDNATLASMKNFISVLEQEKAVMAGDPQAVAELEQMQKTGSAIFDWVKDHPDSVSKASRLASYYIPTTLKLLHTYNEVGATGGDNAESIRRDVSGMLHTLNTAFSNLHDNLLSDVALDVSSEIAAMQGMLARDGLSENDGILKTQE
jgi:hypothetical protein